MSEPGTVIETEQEVRITRIFDAPPELVFAAWTAPEQVAKWFGPPGFDVPLESVEIDARVGGRFALRMMAKDSGRTHSLSYEIVEIDKPGLLVLRSEPMPEMGLNHPIFVRVELVEESGKTRMEFTDGPYPGPGAGGATTAWQHAFDELATALAPPA